MDKNLTTENEFPQHNIKEKRESGNQVKNIKFSVLIRHIDVTIRSMVFIDKDYMSEVKYEQES